MTPPRPTADIDGYVPFPDERIDAYYTEGYWEGRRLHDVLDQAATARPDATMALTDEGPRSYSDMVESTERIASYLLGELDLEPLDRVVFQVTNRVEFIELFFGCARAGVIPVMLLPRHREAEARHIVELADAKAYFTLAGAEHAQFDYVGLVEDVFEDFDDLEYRVGIGGEAPEDWIDYDDLVESDWTEVHGDALDAVEVNPCDPAIFLLSGGTTGMPKAIPRTHNDYTFQWEHTAKAAGMTEDWVTMSSVPIGHNASIVAVLGPAVHAGASFVLEPVLKPDRLADRIESAGVEYTFTVPAQLVDILDLPDIDERDLSSLRAVMSGGQKVRPQLVYDFVERWDLEFYNIFGMAEGPLIFTRPGDSVDVQANTVGTPIHPEADELRIVDETREETVPTGDAGELAVRGPGYFTGYFRNPEENAENFDEDGWFYTEDVLARREDGNYEVFGRLKDTIIRGGENIFAPGVEDEIMEHPSVENVAVVGMPDERLGQRPCAYVELEDGVDALTLETLVDFLDDRGVAVFKRPERLELIEELPRTEVGKIEKVALKDDITTTLKREGRLPEEY